MFGAANNTGGGMFGGASTNNNTSGGGGLFGAKPAAPSPATGGGFGTASGTTGFGATNNNTSGSGGGGLFGNNSTSNQTSGGLFGAKPAAPSSGGLFGGNTNNNAPPANNTTSGGLFGAQQPAPSGGGLFGANNNNSAGNTTGGGGLFGASNNNSNTNTGGGLFGGSNNNTSSNTQGGILGGGATANKPSGGLFGSNNNTTSGTGLFGSNQQQQQPQQQQQGGGLFGQSSTNNSQPSFGWSSNQQQAKPSPFGANNNTTNNNLSLPFGAASTSNNNNNITSTSTNTYTPAINDQLAKIKEQWDPNSPKCALKTHLYNKFSDQEINVLLNQQRPANETPEDWDVAMSNRPSPQHYPVKLTSFSEVATRIEIQLDHVAKSRILLNAINDKQSSLSSKHDLDNTTRILKAKAKHTKLSRRLLRLATVLAILKLKGYPLLPEEEEISRQFDILSHKLSDPNASLGKLNDVFARLAILKERSDELSSQFDTSVNTMNGGLTQKTLESVKGVDGKESSDEKNNDELINKLTKLLFKQQQGLNYLNGVLQKDLEEVNKIKSVN